MITSSSNIQIKNLIVKRAYVSESYLGTLSMSAEEYLKGIEYEIVEDKVLKEAADTMTPQGIMAIVTKPSYELSDFLKGEQINLLLLEDLRDPGNLGTIMRTAEGAGISGVLSEVFQCTLMA